MGKFSAQVESLLPSFSIPSTDVELRSFEQCSGHGYPNIHETIPDTIPLATLLKRDFKMQLWPEFVHLKQFVARVGLLGCQDGICHHSEHQEKMKLQYRSI
jgi:hypothetical protein